MSTDQGDASDRGTSHTPLNFMRIVAILGAAAWSVFLFMRFEASNQDLSLELLRSQNIQASLQIRKADLDISQSEATRIVIEQGIEVTDLGPTKENRRHLFLVKYKYQFSNAGSSRHEITYIIVEAFRARLPMLQDETVVDIGAPVGQSTLTWESVHVMACYCSPKWSEGLVTDGENGSEVLFSKGGGGTGELDVGEFSDGEVELVLRGQRNDLVRFRTRVGFDGGKTPDNRWKLTRTALLKTGNPSAGADGIPGEKAGVGSTQGEAR